MLVLSRRIHEKVILPTVPATIQVVAVKPGVVRLGIEAPPAVPVLREEVRNRSAEWAQEPSAPAAPAKQGFSMNQVLRNRLNIAAGGLELLHRQLHSGALRDAEVTLEKVQDELALLRQRIAREADAQTQAARACRALLVEDDQNERELLASFLRMAGIAVDTASDGCDALAYLHDRGRPDVVLLDMGLPRCDGPTAVRQIRQNPALAGLKIFAVTGHSPDEYNLARGPAGIDRWFQKPLDPSALVRDLNRDLNGLAR